MEKNSTAQFGSGRWRVLLCAIGVMPLIGLTGCESRSYELDVEAKSAPPEYVMGRESYTIVTRNLEIDQTSLRHKEAKEQVRTALSGIGWYEAPNPEDADMVVELDYGISPPREILVEYQEPIYVTVPGEVRYVQRMVRAPNGQMVPVMVPVQDPPRRVFAGTQTRVRPETVYEKHLTITGLNNQQGERAAEQREEIWAVNVSSQSKSDDLREHIPVMAAAALDYVGTNTGEQKRVRVRKDDRDVAFIREGYSEDGPFSSN